jgi:hypothetical protein
MISMTAYWQAFEVNVNALLAISDSEYKKSPQIKAAFEMVKLGKSIEDFDSALSVKPIPDQITNASKGIGPSYNLRPNGDFRGGEYNLPKSNDTQSLSFALLYLYHLENYQNVSYEGKVTSDSWPLYLRSKVITSVENKKFSTAGQAKPLKKMILTYCKENGIEIGDDTLFLKKGGDVNQYLSDLKNKISTTPNIEEKVEKSNFVDDALLILKNKSHDFSTQYENQRSKLEAFQNKLTAYDLQVGSLENRVKQYEKRPAIIRFFHSLISWFYKVTELKEIELSESMLHEKEQKINEQLPHGKTKEIYIGELKRDVDSAKKEYDNAQKDVAEKEGEIELKIQQEQNHKKIQQQKHIPIENQITVSADDIVQSPERKTTADSPWSFFNPSGYVPYVVAAGAVIAAVAINSLG